MHCEGLNCRLNQVSPEIDCFGGRLIFISGSVAQIGLQRVRGLDRSGRVDRWCQKGGRKEVGAEIHSRGSTVALIKSLPRLIASVVVLYIGTSSPNNRSAACVGSRSVRPSR